MTDGIGTPADLRLAFLLRMAEGSSARLVDADGTEAPLASEPATKAPRSAADPGFAAAAGREALSMSGAPTDSRNVASPLAFGLPDPVIAPDAAPLLLTRALDRFDAPTASAALDVHGGGFLGSSPPPEHEARATVAGSPLPHVVLREPDEDPPVRSERDVPSIMDVADSREALSMAERKARLVERSDRPDVPESLAAGSRSLAEGLLAGSDGFADPSVLALQFALAANAEMNRRWPAESWVPVLQRRSSDKSRFELEESEDDDEQENGEDNPDRRSAGLSALLAEAAGTQVGRRLRKAFIFTASCYTAVLNALAREVLEQIGPARNNDEKRPEPFPDRV